MLLCVFGQVHTVERGTSAVELSWFTAQSARLIFMYILYNIIYTHTITLWCIYRYMYKTQNTHITPLLYLFRRCRRHPRRTVIAHVIYRNIIGSDRDLLFSRLYGREKGFNTFTIHFVCVLFSTNGVCVCVCVSSIFSPKIPRKSPAY